MLSSSSKRARAPRLWHRIIDNREPRHKLRMNESPSVSSLLSMKNFHLEELGINDMDTKRLDKWIDGLSSGTAYATNVNYEQNNYTKFADDSYEGSLNLGRMFARYPSGGPVYRSQGLKRVMRNTLYSNTHYEIDMVNCHPTILTWLFGHLKLDAFNDYVSNRASILDELKDVTHLFPEGPQAGVADGIPANIAKKMVNAIINNAGKTFGLFGADT